MLKAVMNFIDMMNSPYLMLLFLISGGICVLAHFPLKETEYKKEGKLSLYMGVSYIGFFLVLIGLSIFM